MQMHVYIHGNIIKPITVQSNQSIGKYRLISFLFLARILDFFLISLGEPDEFRIESCCMSQGIFGTRHPIAADRLVAHEVHIAMAQFVFEELSDWL